MLTLDEVSGQDVDRQRRKDKSNALKVDKIAQWHQHRTRSMEGSETVRPSDGIDGGVTVVYYSPRTLCNVKLPKHPLIFRGSLAEELSIGWKPLLLHYACTDRHVRSSDGRRL
jgi:hypothetical protein